MQIRKTTLADIDTVAAIYDRARIFMCEQGNPTQWAGEYPNADTARADVANGVGYVCEEGGRVVGAFAFIVGEEPTYQVIEGGSWRRTAQFTALPPTAQSEASLVRVSISAPLRFRT